MNILVIDIGGTHIKALATGQPQRVKFASGPDLTPATMVAAVQAGTAEWSYDVVSIGYPGVVRNNAIAVEPVNLTPGWVGYDFHAAFGRPVKIVNDAAMQALGSYNGGRMLFLGLGTGLGTAFIVDGALAPLELAHLPYKKGKSFEEVVGRAGLEKLGKKKWLQEVHEVVRLLKNAMQADSVVLGGGNAKLLKELPPDVRLGANANAFIGGYRLWGEGGSMKGEL
jgi:polyphosphate glucokinase